MKLIKDSVVINETVHQEFSQVSVDGDIIVPDVKPDILKILQVDAVSVITDKVISDGNLSVNGKVNLKILYVPDRADETIKSMTTSFDFSNKVNNQSIANNMSANVESDVQRVEFNMINSRKLSVKTVLAVESTISGNREVEMVTDIENDVPMEIKKETLSVYNFCAESEDEFVVKDNIEVPSGKMSIREVLKTDYKISDKEIRVVSGKVIAKGVVNACILYTGEDNSLEFMELDLPFTEVLDVSDASEGVNCDTDFSIVDMYCDTEEDSDGDMRVVNMEFLVSAKTKINTTEQLQVVKDCYCPGSDTKITRENCVIDEVIAQPKSQSTIREIIAIESNLPQIMGVYNVITKAYVTETTIETGKVKVEGIIDCYILYLSDNSDSPVYSYKKEIPFHCVLDAPNSKNGMDCEVKAEVEHSSYNLNMANEVELRCILSVETKVINKKKVDLITDGELSEISGKEKKGIVIYFVQQGDTLWNIAKRYRISLDDIASWNELDTSAPLNIGQQLIIPSSHKNIA